MDGDALPDSLAVVPAGALALLPDLVPTAGAWRRSVSDARFFPRFPPAPETELVVVGRSDDGWQELARIGIPRLDREPGTVVMLIEPDVESVPANLLRFAVTFSTRMEDGSAAGRIRVLDESGVELPGTLLDMPPELWDRDHRRLTVLLEPGRIKRGLQPNAQAGSPLREGSSVELVVDAGIRDAAGLTLTAPARRAYRVGAPIRRRVDPTAWQIEWPDASSKSLFVRFDRPLDGAMVRRCLSVLDAGDRALDGHAVHDQALQTWTFTPAESDAAQLRVDARLEDLAGNSVRRVFDRDLDESDGAIEDAVVVLRR